MERLLDVAGKLAAATTREEVARFVVEDCIGAIEASYGGIWLVEPGPDGERVLRMLAVSRLPRGGAESWATFPLALDAPVPDAVRTGRPVIVESFADYERRYPHSFARVRHVLAPTDCALAQMPLIASGGVLGAISMTYEQPAALDASERTFLAILAHQCAIALERAELLANEQATRIRAEQAMRAREEILAVVSHDLRNPLTSILVSASSLLQVAEPTTDKQRVHVAAERIHKSAQRLARLVEDLGDFAGIQAGTLALHLAPHAPIVILATAAELYGPLVEERGLGFEVASTPDLPNVRCDANRAVQVIANLILSSLKVTPRSGRITLGARPGDGRDSAVVFYVRDTGPGSDAGPSFSLTIARGIVEAHGGKLWIDREPGRGSTYRFTLASALA